MKKKKPQPKVFLKPLSTPPGMSRVPVTKFDVHFARAIAVIRPEVEGIATSIQGIRDALETHANEIRASVLAKDGDALQDAGIDAIRDIGVRTTKMEYAMNRIDREVEALVVSAIKFLPANE